MEGNITPPTHLLHSSFSTLNYFSDFFSGSLKEVGSDVPLPLQLQN